MKLNQLCEAFKFKISGGSEYSWKCYPHGRYIDFQTDHGFASAIFDPSTGFVYEMTVEQQIQTTDEPKAYRWIDPAYRNEYRLEFASRLLDNSHINDDLFIDEDEEENFMEKAVAIMNGEPFSSTVSICINIDDVTFDRLAKMAHEQDITFNELVNNILREYIKNNPLPADNSAPIDPPERITSWTGIVEDAEDGSGDGVITLPDKFIAQEDWREGDVLEWDQDLDDAIIVRNVSKEEREEKRISDELEQEGL